MTTNHGEEQVGGRAAADYDLPILRGSSQPPAPALTVGPATFTRWSGFYFGGDLSFTSDHTDFSDLTRPLYAFSFRDTTLENEQHPSTFKVLGNGSANSLGGGVFLGYNTQWQDLVLGVEATYTHTNLSAPASSSPIGFCAPGSFCTTPRRGFPRAAALIP